MYSLKAFLLGLVAIICLSSCSNKALQLSLQPETNNSFTYRVTQNTENAVTVMGTDQQTSTEQIMDYEYSIQKVNADGSIELTNTLKKMRMEQAMPMFALVFDSEKPEDNTPEGMLDGLSKLIGTQFGIKMAKDGEVLDVKVEKELFKGMFEGMPNGEMMEQQMEAQFGSETLAAQIKELSGFYPETPIKVGDSWTKTNKTEAIMALEVETIYSLKERKNGVALIEFSSKLKSLTDSKPMEMMGMTMEYDMTGTQSGTIKVDEKTGWAIRSETKQIMAGKMKMSGGQIGGEMEADMKIDSKVLYEKID